MPNSDLYYTPPSDEVFKELKQKAIAIWKTYDDDPSYADEKISRVLDLENFSDNFMTIVAMFDSNNQQRLSESLSVETRLSVHNRMVAGGQPEMYNPF